ncbi:hypothetical protein AB0F17_43100 [Nonomuraea sp. NPDC026600]|uniref:hypothetical protein n=1 Tax=Nonomuraea sp. NPDC026600 TaxID=3155363 RepID=UPI0033E4949B
MNTTTTPTLQELQPGRLVYIPAGASSVRTRPLAMILSETVARELHGSVPLTGQALRADGSNPLRYRTTFLTATFTKLTIAPPGIRRCVATRCPNTYDAIAMYETGELEPGWRMLQRGHLGGTNLCPRHAPTATPDGTTRLHMPEAMDRDTGTITCTCGVLIRPLMARKNDTVVRGACVLAYGVHIAAMTPRRPS